MTIHAPTPRKLATALHRHNEDILDDIENAIDGWLVSESEKDAWGVLIHAVRHAIVELKGNDGPNRGLKVNKLFGPFPRNGPVGI